MGNIDITDISTWTECTVTIRLDPTHDVPEMNAQYVNGSMQPDYVRIRYIFGPGQHRGWWVAKSILVAGHRVLKPAADGTQRLGKDRRKHDFTTWYGGDVQSVKSEIIPEWLDLIVSELRPSGQVTLPGGG